MTVMQETVRADFAEVLRLAADAGLTLPAGPDGSLRPGVWLDEGGDVDPDVVWHWVRTNLDVSGSAAWWLCRGQVDRACQTACDDAKLRNLERRRSAMVDAAETLTVQLADAPTDWLRRAWTRALGECRDDARLYELAVQYLQRLDRTP